MSVEKDEFDVLLQAENNRNSAVYIREELAALQAHITALPNGDLLARRLLGLARITYAAGVTDGSVAIQKIVYGCSQPAGHA